MKILVCAHKDTFVKNDKLYIPIQVGKETSNCSLNFQGDNEGDNISKRNESYCELTAHYWAWKNLKEFDIIGLCHYRRYFKLEDSLFSFPRKIFKTLLQITLLRKLKSTCRNMT